MDNNFVKMIGYDAEGNAHVLFDTTKENNNIEKMPMPELETGMFIKLSIYQNQEVVVGFVYDGYIIWKNGGWDNTCDIHEDKHYNNTEDDFAYLTIYEISTPYYFPKKEKSEYDYRKVIWEGEVYYG